MFKKKLKTIWENKFVKSVLVVASGTAGAQVIGMAFVPFITRTYGPEVYGVLGTFIALIGILGTFSALSYPIAIVLPSSDTIAKSLIKLSLIIAAGISWVIFLLLWIGGDFVFTTLGISSLADYVFFIPLMVFFIACQDVSQQWLIRKKLFRSIARISIYHSVLSFGAQALVGLYAPVALVLISIQTLSTAVRSILMALAGKDINSTSLKNNDKYISLREVAFKYKDFPIYRTPQVVLDAISQSLPTLMLTAFFGPAVAGFYTLTRIVLSMPGRLLAGSVQSVFYPHFNELYLEKKKMLPLIFKAAAGLAFISIWPFLLVVLFGPNLFSIVFGENWFIAGEFAQWISVWVFFNLINRPAISAISVFNLQSWFLKFEIISLLLRFLGLWIGFYHYNNAKVAVALFSIAGAFLAIAILIKVVFFASKLDRTNGHE